MNIIHENFRRFIKESKSSFNLKDFRIIYEKIADEVPERLANWDKMNQAERYKHLMAQKKKKDLEKGIFKYEEPDDEDAPTSKYYSSDEYSDKTEKISISNYKKLISLTFKTTGGRDENLMGKFSMDEREIKSFIQQISALQKNNIIKGLAAGAFGATYLLDNDHVLKIFYAHSPNAMSADLAKYKNIQQKQFQGKSTKHEPAIYDFGEASTGSKVFGWAEMGKVIPMKQWLLQTKREPKNIIDILNEIDLIFSSYQQITWNWIVAQLSKPFMIDLISNSGLTKKEIIEIARMLFKHKKNTGAVGDFHMGNF